MPLIPPIPRELHALVKQNTHPGLKLDRFAESWDDAGDRRGLSERVQGPTIEKVISLSNNPPLSIGDYADLFKRWQATITKNATAFTGTTAGPMTLHLARASALENAGICLHRIYGFVYLPGSGLKGLARAFAETVWLENETDKVAGWAKIEAVFGWAPGSDDIKDGAGKTIQKPWKSEAGIPKRGNADLPSSTGSVIFHDAWPVAWPKLVKDILNSHHSEYYSETPPPPPGDWEDPIPVYFLSVEPGTQFHFVVAKRRDDVTDELVTLAADWLAGGLTQLGAGAKTASGYGDFEVDGHDAKPKDTEKRKHFTATLELVTPAFLAGANQQMEDCDLRPSTLRGQLRWWWRTMHAGFVDVETLRKMEAAIWGDTKQGGAVRVTVVPGTRSKVELVPGKYILERVNWPDALRPDPVFIETQGLIPSPDTVTTQGILYISYGMDEMPSGRPLEHKRRHVMHPGASWEARFVARPAKLKLDANTSKAVGPELLLEQARAALWLLTRYGGVGSKNRHGFGSLVTHIEGWTLDRVKQVAATFRGNIPELTVAETDSAALRGALLELEFAAPWPDIWFTMDQFGFSLQAFAQLNKRKWRKEALGLPRKIGISTDDGSGRRPSYNRTYDRQTRGEVVWLGQFHRLLGTREAENMRHASPVHFHFEPAPAGGYVVRAIAFPTPILADATTSRAVLQELLDHLKKNIPERVNEYPPFCPVLAAHQRVKAKIVDDPRGKARPFAELQGLVGNILNVPAEHTLIVDEVLDLIINNVNVAAKQIAFRWPLPSANKPVGKK